MYSLQQIEAMNDEATRNAKKEGLKPLRAWWNGDESIFKCPQLGYYVPDGFEIVDTYFVDNSGFGSESEPALTIRQFLKKVKKNYYYAIKSAGQFQIYINEYKKI